MAADELSVLSALKSVAQQYHQHDHQLRKLAKLHERLAAKDGYLSLNGAGKLLRAYEVALDGALLQNSAVNLAQIKLGSLIEHFEGERGREMEGMGVQDVMINDGLEVESTAAQQPTREESPLVIESQAESTPQVIATTIPTTELERVQEVEPLPSANDKVAMDGDEQGLDVPVDIEGVARGEAPKPKDAVEQLDTGSAVAVLCKVDKDSPQEDWILATILRSVTDGYEVEDVEFDDPSMPASGLGSSPIKNRPLRITVASNKVRLLPSVTEAETDISIRPRQRVLALFPGTTCLYPATVISTPARRKRTRDYMVKFSDDTVSARPVPPRYVLPLDEES